jgi:glycosyltransferase involved in cell wall biosynthesis
MRVAALIPAYQAAAHLGEVILRIQALAAPPEILVVDDGSRDATAAVAEQHGARVLRFAGNRGKGAALSAGFEALREFDAVITIDADGQHPPECVPDFIAAAGDADLVLGARARTPDMPASRRFANAFSSGWASRLAGQRVSDSQCGYRLYRREVFERTPHGGGRYEFETSIAIRAARLGFRLGEVTIPTVYGEEKSQIRAFQDVPRIVGVMLRLTFEGRPTPRVPPTPTPGNPS